MAAIIGLDDEAVRSACAEAAEGDVCEAVNFNAPGQVVIAGHAAAVGRAIEAAKARGAKRAMALPVSAPFHSSLMAPAAARLREALERVAVNSPRIPVIHNVDAKSHTDASGVKEALVTQADHPVRWVECVREIAARGEACFRMRPGKGARAARQTHGRRTAGHCARRPCGSGASRSIVENHMMDLGGQVALV